jgi:hypothetical protein
MLQEIQPLTMLTRKHSGAVYSHAVYDAVRRQQKAK